MGLQTVGAVCDRPRRLALDILGGHRPPLQWNHPKFTTRLLENFRKIECQNRIQAHVRLDHFLVFRIERDTARFLHDVVPLTLNLPAWRDITVVVDAPDADESAFRFGDAAVGDLSDHDPAAFRQDLHLADTLNTCLRAPDDSQRLDFSIRRTVKNQDGFPACPISRSVPLAFDLDGPIGYQKIVDRVHGYAPSGLPAHFGSTPHDSDRSHVTVRHHRENQNFVTLRHNDLVIRRVDFQRVRPDQLRFGSLAHTYRSSLPV